MIDLSKHPELTGQTVDGSFTYDLPSDVVLPFPNRPLVPAVFINKSALEVVTTMAQKKLDYEANQAVSLKHPPVWENVGYVVEADKVTAYYQIGYPVMGDRLVTNEPDFHYAPAPDTRGYWKPTNGIRVPWGHEPWER